jgi:hypothetical protein
VGEGSGVGPPSAYTIVEPTGLKTKSVMIANDRRDVRVLLAIDPPYKHEPKKPIKILIA